MRHHLHTKNYEFVKEPEKFNKNTDKELLKYCLGATMYTPGTRDIYEAVKSNKWPGLTSLVMCFEDAIDESDLPLAEQTVSMFLKKISDDLLHEIINLDNLPLLIIRIRNLEQFKTFTMSLSKEQLDVITAFNIPKFTSKDADEYLDYLQKLNEKFGTNIYAMPILESKIVAYKESRLEELQKIKGILKKHSNNILNIRVGATDFSSYYGRRRGIDYTIYDIHVVRDILTDILNVLTREDSDFVISAPVWEYFLVNSSMKFLDTIDSNVASLLKRPLIINEAVDGLIREIVLDKANGFIGKTIIHPSHIQYVNSLYAVTLEEFEDATQIMTTKGGVIKSNSSNKMNEIRPHLTWAKSIVSRARAYGVIKNESEYFNLMFYNSNKS